MCNSSTQIKRICLKYLWLQNFTWGRSKIRWMCSIYCHCNLICTDPKDERWPCLQLAAVTVDYTILFQSRGDLHCVPTKPVSIMVQTSTHFSNNPTPRSRKFKVADSSHRCCGISCIGKNINVKGHSKVVHLMDSIVESCFRDLIL